VLKIVQCVWPLTEQARAENRAVCLSWSNAPYQRCSSGTYGIGMVQCSVPKVLEYARRAVTVRRMALVLKIVSKIVRETYGIGAENRVENRAVCLSWSNAPYQRCSSMRDGL
jgi:hypothetical protein